MIDLSTDEEAMRITAMGDGVKKIGRIKLRPLTALTMSQMQRNDMLEEGNNTLQKGAAYAYLHSAPKDEIRAVVNNKEKFLDAVDEWLDKNFSHHSEMEQYMLEMGQSFDQYMAAQSTGSGPYQDDGSKN